MDESAEYEEFVRLTEISEVGETTGPAADEGA